MAIAALVLGIIGVLASLSGSVIGFLLSVLAIIFGAISKKKTGLKKAKAGFVLGIIGTIVSIVVGFASPKLLEYADDNKNDQSSVKSSEQPEKAPDLTVAQQQEKPKSGLQVTSFNYKGMSVSYLSAQTGTDTANDQVVIMYFGFENNSEDNAAFMYNFTVKAFQNGVQLDNDFFISGNEAENYAREVQPGNKVTVAVGFETSDYTNPIDVEIEPWISVEGEKLAKFTVNF